MSEILSPESTRARELENMLSSAYDKLFDDLGRSTDLEAVNIAQQILMLGIIEHSVVGDRDYPAEAVGVPERSWPNLIRNRIESYEQSLDIVPEKIKGFGERVIGIDPKAVKVLPSMVHGSPVFNSLRGDADDLEATKFAIENFCPDAIIEPRHDIPKVA